MALQAILNLPFWLLTIRYSIVRPILNADFIVALLAAPFGIAIQIALVILIWLLDAAQSMSFIYHFSSATEFFASFEFAKHLGWRHFVTIEAFVVLFVFSCCLVVAALFMKRVKPRRLVIFCVFTIVTTADIVNGSGAPLMLDSHSLRLPYNIQGSTALNLGIQITQARTGSAKPLAKLDPLPAVNPVRWAEQHPSGSILIILVESWGLNSDPQLADWLRGKLVNPSILSKWRVQNLTVPFRGATTAGELRILCGLSGHYSRLTAAQGQDCLVEKVHKLGFETIAMHGFTGNMFNRISWWPVLGFSKTLFTESIPTITPKCGGSFQGLCDNYMLNLAKSELGPRKLVYLLTLNTHLPLLALPIQQDLIDLCARRGISENVCQLTSQLGAVLSTASNVLLSLKDLPYTIVAGDHSPPFLVNKDRLAFNQALVPMLVLEPN